MSKWWKRAILFIPVTISLGFFLFLSNNKEAPIQKSIPEYSHLSRVILARKLEVSPKAHGYGIVKAARVWNVIARVSGEIEFIHPEFKKGAILKAGTELVRISPRDYKLQLKQSQANIRQAEAKVSELKTKQQSLMKSLDIEQRVLKLNEKQLARKQQLRQRGTIAEAALDTEENLVLIQLQKIQDIQNSLDLIPLQIEAQEEQISVYEAQYETAKINLARVHVKLPFDARVSNTNVEVTQYVQTGNEMGTVDNTETVEVEAQIPLSQFRQFLGILTEGEVPTLIDGQSLLSLAESVGLHAMIRLPLDKGTAVWRGRVVRVTDEIDPKTRTVGVVIEVDHPYEKIIPGKRPLLSKGMFVEVELSSDPLSEMFIIPRSALHEEGLYIVGDDNRLQIRPVTTTLLQGNLAMLAEGLEENERIVVSDLLYATPGMLMKTKIDEDLLTLIHDEATNKDVSQ
ncbi:efflux RND transporter periplasmic adaptor subunit [Pseudovibrio brasiliensis]|uniref:Multidrug resistance protein MdtA n=1 Tax=Pseudovibrio brasiliensis TaxID=1898042 RepID=A0ABX8AQW9_9HYPH|nr:HlyD family efflux transporter periplasmic adaptor subunit [Pseudovibrio brasiliensis]QUS57120.1 hypothetical protein KGB56_06935 [Pseudovibrio brasiliensis]